MARVKIISDPYENKITYMKWDTENGGSWQPITNEGSSCSMKNLQAECFRSMSKKL